MTMIGLTIWVTGEWIPHDMTIAGVLSQIFYWTNYYYLIYGKEEFMPFTAIYWSLAIEEHFYIFFPLAFVLAMRFLSLKNFARALLLTCLLVLFWRLFLVLILGVSESYTYRATDARFDSILFGCLLAVTRNPVMDKDIKISIAGKYILLALALLTILFTFIYRDEIFRATIRYTLQGLSLLIIFWLAIRHADWPVFSWLNLPAMRKLGVYSYSIYLSHMFFLFVAGNALGVRGFTRAIIGFALTLIFCALLHRFVERPIAKYRMALR